MTVLSSILLLFICDAIPIIACAMILRIFHRTIWNSFVDLLNIVAIYDISSGLWWQLNEKILFFLRNFRFILRTCLNGGSILKLTFWDIKLIAVLVIVPGVIVVAGDDLSRLSLLNLTFCVILAILVILENFFFNEFLFFLFLAMEKPSIQY